MLQQSVSTKSVGILPPFATAVKQSFYVAGLLLAMGGFVLQLGQSDLTLAPVAGAGSLLSQSILAVVYLGGAVFLFTSGQGGWGAGSRLAGLSASGTCHGFRGVVA